MPPRIYDQLLRVRPVRQPLTADRHPPTALAPAAKAISKNTSNRFRLRTHMKVVTRSILDRKFLTANLTAVALAIASAIAPAADKSNDAYTITTKLRLTQPYDVKAMNDEFQSARLLNEKDGVGTFEITYRPLHVQDVGSDPDWRVHDEQMTEYLRPRPAANWDAELRNLIITDLKADGIDPTKLDDRTLVTKVSDWAMKRSQFNDQFGLWMVAFQGGKPIVPPKFRSSFASQEPKGFSDELLWDREVFGKGMYLNKTHGACTSSSTYLTTILRAIGIPTRIILTVPACDPNDQTQVAMLAKAIRHHQTAQAIRLAGHSKGFVNHVFNEVWVGGKWVRLNYNRLGQPTLDANYGGLITHVYTALDISEVPFAQTWGDRFALGEGPKLSSVNPYQLLSARDDLTPGTTLENPAVQQLKAVTVIAVLKNDDPALPSWAKLPPDADAFFQIKEWIQGQNYTQLREFESEAARSFTLTAEGHPPITARLQGLKVDDEHGGFQAFAVKLTAKPTAGVSYKIVPSNTGHPHTWSIGPGVIWKG